MSAPQHCLLAGNDHFAPFRGEHASGGRVHMREEDLLHASAQHAHAPTRGFLGRMEEGSRSNKRAGTSGNNASIAAKPPGQQPIHPAGAQQPTHSAFLISQQRQRQQRAAASGWGNVAKISLRNRRSPSAARNIAFNLRARSVR